MKNFEKYFKKNGFIFGVSSVFNFGTWQHKAYKFDSLQAAEKWLETETGNFAERELVSKSRVIKLVGRKAINAL